MKTFTHEDLTVAYDDVGRGPAILMLHNGGTSSTIWRHQVEDLSSDHRVVALDLPGFGQSPRPATPPKLGQMVDLVVAMIRELDLAPVLLVGNCMGTNISATIARTEPDLVTGILAVNPLTEASFGAGKIGFTHKLGNVAAGPSKALRSLSRRVRAPKQVGVGALRFQLGKAGIERDLHHDPELLACQVRADQMPALVDVLDDMRAYGDADQADLPDDIPVWIVWGEQNRVLSRHKAGHLVDRFGAERVEVLDRCGHLPMLEDPDRITRLIRELIAVTEGSASDPVEVVS